MENIFGEKKSRSPYYEDIKNFINSKGYEEFSLKEVADKDISLNSFKNLVNLNYITHREYKPMTLEEACDLINDMYGEDCYCYNNFFADEGKRERGIPVFCGYEVKDGQICEVSSYYTVKIVGWAD